MINIKHNTKWILLTALGFGLLGGCKPYSSAESDLQDLTETLQLESVDRLDGLANGQCLIEVKPNLNEEAIQRIDKTCLPFDDHNLAWRGRLDISNKEGPKPLALALIVDKSGSLQTTDPNMRRREGVIKLLQYFKEKYRGYYNLLKISVLSFEYCVQRQVDFAGTNEGEFNNFLDKLNSSFFRHGGETNYIDAMQHAREFLDSVKTLGGSWNRHLVMFSDGMPWMLTSSIPSTCDQSVAEQMSTTATNSQLGLENVDGACIYQAPRQNVCGTKVGKYIKPDEGRSAFNAKANASLDPVNFRFAMLDHMKFAQDNITGQGISFHTVFLNSQTCWEQRTSRAKGNLRFEKEFEFMCSTVAENQFFPGLVTGGDSTDPRGTVIKVSNLESLAPAFENIARIIDEQIAFGQIEYQYLTEGGDAEGDGKVCQQVGGKPNCPMQQADVVERLPFTPGSEGDMYNFQLFPKLYTKRDKGAVMIRSLSSNEQPPKPYEFKLEYDLPLAGLETEPSQCNFTVVNEKKDDKYKYQLIQYEGSVSRISCKRVEMLPYKPPVVIDPKPEPKPDPVQPPVVVTDPKPEPKPEPVKPVVVPPVVQPEVPGKPVIITNPIQSKPTPVVTRPPPPTTTAVTETPIRRQPRRETPAVWIPPPGTPILPRREPILPRTNTEPPPRVIQPDEDPDPVDPVEEPDRREPAPAKGEPSSSVHGEYL